MGWTFQTRRRFVLAHRCVVLTYRCVLLTHRCVVLKSAEGCKPLRQGGSCRWEMTPRLLRAQNHPDELQYRIPGGRQGPVPGRDQRSRSHGTGLCSR